MFFQQSRALWYLQSVSYVCICEQNWKCSQCVCMTSQKRLSWLISFCFHIDLKNRRFLWMHIPRCAFTCSIPEYNCCVGTSVGSRPLHLITLFRFFQLKNYPEENANWVKWTMLVFIYVFQCSLENVCTSYHTFSQSFLLDILLHAKCGFLFWKTSRKKRKSSRFCIRVINCKYW